MALTAEEIKVDFVECRKCHSGVSSVYKFCGACGEPTTQFDFEKKKLEDYCGRCGSPLRGLKKYCSQCGDPSPLADEKGKKSGLLELADNPLFQVGLAGALVAIALLPFFTPVRYSLFSGKPLIYVEDERGQARLQLQTSRRNWSIQRLDPEDIAVDPVGVAVDEAGDFYVSDSNRNAIYRISPSGTAELFAGGGEGGFAGDDGPATDALLNGPRGLVFDDTGRLFVADSGNHRIRMIEPDGRIYTVAGCGACSEAGDADDAAATRLLFPAALAFSDNTLLVAEAPAGAGAPRPPTIWSLQPKP